MVTSYFYLFYENLMKIKMIISINKKIDNDKRYRNDKYCEKNHKWKRWKFVKRHIKNKVEKQKIKIKNEFDKKGDSMTMETSLKVQKSLRVYSICLYFLQNMIYDYNICDNAYFHYRFFILF